MSVELHAVRSINTVILWIHFWLPVWFSRLRHFRIPGTPNAATFNRNYMQPWLNPACLPGKFYGGTYFTGRSFWAMKTVLALKTGAHLGSHGGIIRGKSCPMVKGIDRPSIEQGEMYIRRLCEDTKENISGTASGRSIQRKYGDELSQATPDRREFTRPRRWF